MRDEAGHKADSEAVEVGARRCRDAVGVSSLRVFFVGGLLSYRALFGWLSPWILIPTYVIAPIVQILLFVYVGRAAHIQSDEFYVVGNALQYSAIPCIFAMTNTIAGERYQNTLGVVLVTPAKRIPLFLGRSLPVILNGFLVAAFAFAAGGAILGISVPAGSVPALGLVLFVSACAVTGLGLSSAGIGLLARDTATLSNIIFGLLLVFTGANVALSDLPGWMSTLAQGLPLTHGIEAARRLADGASFSSVGGLVAAEALVGAAYALAGYATIRALEWQSRLHATLERA
jgi:ABC-2 type transport system permease protein